MWEAAGEAASPEPCPVPRPLPLVLDLWKHPTSNPPPFSSLGAPLTLTLPFAAASVHPHLCPDPFPWSWSRHPHPASHLPMLFPLIPRLPSPLPMHMLFPLIPREAPPLPMHMLFSIPEPEGAKLPCICGSGEWGSARAISVSAGLHKQGQHGQIGVQIPCNIDRGEPRLQAICYTRVTYGVPHSSSSHFDQPSEFSNLCFVTLH